MQWFTYYPSCKGNLGAPNSNSHSWSPFIKDKFWGKKRHQSPQIAIPSHGPLISGTNLGAKNVIRGPK